MSSTGRGERPIRRRCREVGTRAKFGRKCACTRGVTREIRFAVVGAAVCVAAAAGAFAAARPAC